MNTKKKKKDEPSMDRGGVKPEPFTSSTGQESEESVHRNRQGKVSIRLTCRRLTAASAREDNL